MAGAKVTHVLYAADKDGLTVRIMNGSNTIDEYNSGNSPQDSKAWVHPSDPIAVPVAKLRQYARDTAIEMAAEYGLPKKLVSEDTDLLPIQGA